MGRSPCLSLILVLTSAYLILQAACHEDDIQGESQWFREFPYCIVLAQSYRTITQVTMLECGQSCAWDGRCYSFSYMDDQRQCELIGAARAPTESLPPNGEGGFVTFYHTSTEGAIVAKLLLESTKEPPRLTENNVQTQGLAAAECGVERHLCELWEIEESVQQGNPAKLPENTDMWYAVPDSQAVIVGTDVTEHGLPMSEPSPGVCCSGRRREPQNPVTTVGIYPVDDQSGKAKACAALAAHPCTLAELKAAYLRGYRQSTNRWNFFVMPDRDVRVFGDGCGSYIDRPGECYEGVIPNTPRPTSSGNYVYCCPNLYLK